jgi:hypothetical protein
MIGDALVAGDSLMTTMSASPGNRIQCYRCGHVFDHNPQLNGCCRCLGCGNTISILDGRRTYDFHTNRAKTGGPMQTTQAEPLDQALPPICRDPTGQPLSKPKPEIQPAEKPRFAADDFADIARRLKERQAAEAAARSIAREND